MSRWLLALHSSSETLGLAVCDAEDPAEGIRILSRPMGRQLTNGLIPLSRNCSHKRNGLRLCVWLFVQGLEGLRGRA